MSFRIVQIESEVKMNLKLENIVINKEDDEIWVPLSDISVIIIDNLSVSFTIRMLVALAEYNIVLIICDQKHLPIGNYLPLSSHSRDSKIIKYHIMFNKQDELWKIIVENKINNQAEVLHRLYKSNDVYEKLIVISKNITTGDLENKEGTAAKLYFNELMGTTFSRGNEDILLNSGLDYGYSIIRSYIARLCVSYGLNCQIGIHHKNEYNDFNLVDDLMEPIRPFVDYYAYLLLKDENLFLMEHRKKLVNIINHIIEYKKKKMYFGNMLEDYISQISKYIQGESSQILFPDINKYIGEEKEDEI